MTFMLPFMLFMLPSESVTSVTLRDIWRDIVTARDGGKRDKRDIPPIGDVTYVTPAR